MTELKRFGWDDVHRIEAELSADAERIEALRAAVRAYDEQRELANAMRFVLKYQGTPDPGIKE